MENHDGIDKSIQPGGDGTPTLLQQLGQLARGKPDAIAIDAGGQRVTYGELDEWSNRVAHALIVRGIGRGQVVAIVSTAGPATVASMLGTWKIGAVCLLFDPADAVWIAAESGLPGLVLDDDDLAGYSNLPVGAVDDLPEASYFIAQPADSIAELIEVIAHSDTGPK